MRLLELFAGTGSIGRAFREAGWEVVSLDIDPASGASIVSDILAWDYRAYPKGYFDALWASPVCTHYSRARTSAKTPRDLEGADALVQRTLEIILYFQPKVWGFENPQTGLLKDREVVAGIPYKDISYCMYGYPYRKYTRIWTNSERWVPRPKCTAANPCLIIKEGRHPQSAQRGPCRGKGKGDVCSLGQLYSMPPDLCQEIARAWTLECMD
jgi:site-specific DNA-cytosine methylase